MQQRRFKTQRKPDSKADVDAAAGDGKLMKRDVLDKVSRTAVYDRPKRPAPTPKE